MRSMDLHMNDVPERGVWVMQEGPLLVCGHRGSAPFSGGSGEVLPHKRPNSICHCVEAVKACLERGLRRDADDDKICVHHISLISNLRYGLWGVSVTSITFMSTKV